MLQHHDALSELLLFALRRRIGLAGGRRLRPRVAGLRGRRADRRRRARGRGGRRQRSRRRVIHLAAREHEDQHQREHDCAGNPAPHGVRGFQLVQTLAADFVLARSAADQIAGRGNEDQTYRPPWLSLSSSDNQQATAWVPLTPRTLGRNGTPMVQGEKCTREPDGEADSAKHRRRCRDLRQS